MKAPRADDALERRLVSVRVGDSRLHVGTAERRVRAGEVVADGATVALFASHHPNFDSLTASNGGQITGGRRHAKGGEPC
jgi:hypothetical protein